MKSEDIFIKSNRQITMKERARGIYKRIGAKMIEMVIISTRIPYQIGNSIKDYVQYPTNQF